MLNCLAINRIVTDNLKSPMYVAVNYMSCMQCKYNYRSFQIQSLVKLMRLHCTFNSHCTFACTWVPWRFCFNAGILKIEFSLIECAKLVSTGRNSIEKNKSSGKCFFFISSIKLLFQWGVQYIYVLIFAEYMIELCIFRIVRYAIELHMFFCRIA